MSFKHEFTFNKDSDKNDATDRVEQVFSKLQSHYISLTGLANSTTVTVDPTRLSPVTVPFPIWDEIYLSGANDYFTEVNNSTLGLPDHTPVPYPTPPGLTIPSDTPEYDDSLRQALSDSLVYDLANGGYGIVDLNEEFLFEADRDRNNEELAEAMVLSAVRAGSSGLTKMPGFASRNMFVGVKKLNSTMAQANSKIVSEANDRYIKGKTDTYSNSVDLAKVAFDRYSLALRTAATAYKAKMENFYAQIKSGYELASSETEGYLSLVSAYSSEMDGIYSSYKALSSVKEFEYRQYNNETLATLEENKAVLAAIIEELKLETGIGNAKVKAHAGMAAAALSGIDINARSSVSKSYSDSLNVQDSHENSDEYAETNALDIEGIVNSDGGSGSWNWR